MYCSNAVLVQSVSCEWGFRKLQEEFGPLFTADDDYELEPMTQEIIVIS